MKHADLTIDQWQIIKPLFVEPPENEPRRGRPKKQDFVAEISGALYVLNTGCSWRKMPKRYPNWTSIHFYLKTWQKNGTWDKAMRVLNEFNEHPENRN